MVGDRARMEKMTAPSTTKGFHAYAFIRVDENLLDTSLTMNTDPALTLGSLKLKIVYRPRTDQPKYAGRDYIVVCSELLKCFDSRFVDWADFCARAERDPIVGFIKKWSPITEKWFEMAKANPGVDLPFGIDWGKYHEHLEKKYEERYGVRPAATERLLSYEIEGEASAASTAEYQETIYKESIKRKLSKGAKKKA